MKMSAKEYNNLRTVRNVRGLIRRKARSVSKGWSLTDSKSKKKRAKVTMKLWDVNGGNILKVRRYKGKILNQWQGRNYQR